MAEPSDYSRSSEDDEYSDPLEVAELCVDQSIQMCPRGIEWTSLKTSA